jgi:hypothetical protein
MIKYRFGHFLFGQQAAVGRYVRVASYTACQERRHLSKGCTQCIPVIATFRKWNKNSTVLKLVLKFCLLDSINWPNLRNTLLALWWSSLPEILKHSQRIFFLFLPESGICFTHFILQIINYDILIDQVLFTLFCWKWFSSKMALNCFLKYFAPNPNFEIWLNKIQTEAYCYGTEWLIEKCIIRSGETQWFVAESSYQRQPILQSRATCTRKFRRTARGCRCPLN